MKGKIVISPLFETLTRPPGQIVHIGGGAERNLPVYLASGAGKITLVEADPAAAEVLEARVAAHPAVQVIPAAISATSGMRPYYRMSLPDLNGFRAPEGMSDLFPGLTQISADPLTPVSPVDLILSLLESAKAEDRPNILVIEVLGETVDILQALAVTGQLARFERLALRTARAPLYGNTLSQAEFISFLEDTGFELIVPPGGDDPDMPVFLAQPNREAALIQEIADLKATCESDQGRLAAVIAERNTARGEIHELKARETELYGKMAELEADCDTARAQVAELTETVAALGQVAELTETVGELQERVPEPQEEVTEKEAEIAQALDQAESFRNEMYRAKGQVELREADLLDLQARYRELNETKEAQDALLADLARDLDAALALLKPVKQPASSKASSSKPAARKTASSKSIRPKPAGAAKAKS